MRRTVAAGLALAHRMRDKVCVSNDANLLVATILLLTVGCGSDGSSPAAAAATDAATGETAGTGSIDSTSGSEAGGPSTGTQLTDGGSSSTTTGAAVDTCARGDDLPRMCIEDWFDDGECDSTNNNSECNFDGGDCCAETCVDAGAACGEFGYDCRDPAAGGYGDAPIPQLGDGECASAANPFAEDALRDEVTLLSTDELAGRDPGFRGDRITRRYIEQHFECLGLTPGLGGCYQQPFRNDAEDPTANVVGFIPGSDPEVSGEIIVVGAHHDHLGVEDGEIINGANDNVSGVVALLAVARAIVAAPAAPRRTVAFVAFGSEEAGLDGSIFFTEGPPDELPLDDVVYMVNLDMLGTYDIAGEVSAFGTFEGSPGREILDDLLLEHPDLQFTLGFASPEGDSDYDAFCEAEIPYVYFETFDEPCWHEPCDDVERMDFPHMSTLAQIEHDIIVGLANSTLDLPTVRVEQGCPRQPEP